MPSDDQVRTETMPRMVMKLEMVSDDVRELDAACSEFAKGMRQIGHDYSGPIPLPKQKEKDRTIHTRVFELETNDRVALWLKSFVPGESVTIRCKVIERK